MNILDLNTNPCSGCSICTITCPFSAITMSLSDEGFLEPIIDKLKCTNCGVCISTCYKNLDQVIESPNQKLYAAKALDKSLLTTVSSGGLAYLLGVDLINSGYKVTGAIYNYDKNIVEMKIAKSLKDLDDFKGSKYLQAYSENILNSINLNKNDKYAFFGLPCQIYALKTYLKNKKLDLNNYVFIDFFCHGVPSYNIWHKFISKYGKFEMVNFRNKKNGWHNYSLKLKNPKINKISPSSHNKFYEMFFSDKYLNKSCYTCKLRQKNSYSDLRLGDFWGSLYVGDEEGISAVIVGSEKGQRLLEKIADKIETKEHSLDVLEDTQNIFKDYDINIRETDLLKNSSKYSFSELYRKYRQGLSQKKKIKIFTKRIVISILPLKIVTLIRKKVLKWRKR